MFPDNCNHIHSRGQTTSRANGNMGPRDRLEHHQKEIIEDKIQKERNKS